MDQKGNVGKKKKIAIENRKGNGQNA